MSCEFLKNLGDVMSEKVQGKVIEVLSEKLILELENKKLATLNKNEMFVSKKRKLTEIFSKGFIIEASIKKIKDDEIILTQKNINKENFKKPLEKTSVKKDNTKNKKTKKIEQIKITEQDRKQDLENNEEEVIKKVSLSELKNLKNIGNIKISKEKTKQKTKLKKKEEEKNNQAEITLPKNYMENFINEVKTLTKEFDRIKKELNTWEKIDEN